MITTKHVVYGKVHTKPELDVLYGRYCSGSKPIATDHFRWNGSAANGEFSCLVPADGNLISVK